MLARAPSVSLSRTLRPSAGSFPFSTKRFCMRLRTSLVTKVPERLIQAATSLTAIPVSPSSRWIAISISYWMPEMPRSRPKSARISSIIRP